MASAEKIDDAISAVVVGGGGGGGDHVVEMIASNGSASSSSLLSADGVVVSDEITPLLTQAEKPKINIFSVSYPRKMPRDQLTKFVETEISQISQFVLWAWNGSRYSGLVCMALSSTIYCIMEVLSDIFSGQSIPLFETAFTRCTIILILSYFWLRRTGQPILGPTHVRSILFARALVGYLSLFSFIYCIQRLPLSQAIVLSFTTPIIASIVARVFFQERLKIADIVGLLFLILSVHELEEDLYARAGVIALLTNIQFPGLACSFFGILFIFRPMLTTQGKLVKSGEASDMYITGSHHIYAVLAGLFSSITGGISYCLIRASARASDQPVLTVFSFGILASPAAAICTFSFQEFVLPGLSSFLLMVVLGVLAFLAEVFLARGLQLENTSKIANVIYIEAALSQVWGIASSRLALSFGRLVGCLLIFISVSCTMFIGPDKEIE